MAYRPGKQFGCWKLLEQVGKGGNGHVWSVVSSDGRRGAIKVLSRFEKDRVQRFRHEIQALRSCGDVSGVLPIWDSGFPEHVSASNPPWFVAPMATPIKVRLGANRTLRDVVLACVQFAEVLTAIHARNYSHRDIKPENLFWHEGRCAIGDFGLVDFPDKTPVTIPGRILGPLHYIAPEMVMSPATSDGKAADVYSLSKTLWVLSTQYEYPLPGPHRPDDEAYRIGSYVGDLGTERLDRLLAAATCIDPSDRCSMGEFAASLHCWLNPVERCPMDTTRDFSQFEQLVEDLAAPQRATDAQRSAIRNRYLAGELRILRRLETELGSIAQVLRTAGLSVGFHSPGSLRFELFEHCRGHRLERRGTSRIYGVEAAIRRNDRANSFWTGILLRSEIVENPRIELTAIHAATLPGQTPMTCYWHQTKSFLLDGPDEESVINSILNGLNGHLENAVEAYLNTIRAGW